MLGLWLGSALGLGLGLGLALGHSREVRFWTRPELSFPVSLCHHL